MGFFNCRRKANSQTLDSISKKSHSFIRKHIWGYKMPAITKSMDLVNNFNEIMEYCQNYKKPVFVSNNGMGRLAVMSEETYEEITGIRELCRLLEEGEKSIANGNYLTLEEMNKSMDLM
jgi:PHD/YefM family antitoxin component YafN of YafNO toxin-antitoxin module